jgi:hypothetical protein
LERSFAKYWAIENKPRLGKRNGTLEYLIHGDGTSVIGDLTQEEATTAATVVQWLGSPVGFGFLEKVLASEGMEIIRKVGKYDRLWKTGNPLQSPGRLKAKTATLF